MNFFKHLEKHAPDLRRYLNRPVSARALKQLESKTKFKLPPALVKLLQEHNGEQNSSAGVFFGLHFLSAEEMLSDWTLNIQFHEDHDTNAFSFPPGHIKEDYYNPGWLPIASNFDGNYLGIDFSPGPEGKKGQIINFGRDEHHMYVIAPSFAKFLDLMTQNVDFGNCVWRTEKDRSFFAWKDDSSFLDHVSEVVASDAAGPSTAEPLSFDSEWRAFLLKLVGTEKPALANLHAITSLYLMSAGVTDLSPLKYFKNTRELIASTIRSRVFDPIASLTQLKRCTSQELVSPISLSYRECLF